MRTCGRRRSKGARRAWPAYFLRASPGLQLNDHLDGEDGPAVFAHACQLGYEGIVSKGSHRMKISFRQMSMSVAALSVAGVSALGVIGWSESAAQQGPQPPFLPLSISIN